MRDILSKEEQIQQAENLIKFLMWCKEENPTATHGNITIDEAVNAFSVLMVHPVELMKLTAGIPND
jgi:hypothetical protein